MVLRRNPRNHHQQSTGPGVTHPQEVCQIPSLATPRHKRLELITKLAF